MSLLRSSRHPASTDQPDRRPRRRPTPFRPISACPVACGSTRVFAMRTHVVDHPLVAHKLTVLRDEETDSPTFRRLADELVTLLASAAPRAARVEAGGSG